MQRPAAVQTQISFTSARERNRREGARAGARSVGLGLRAGVPQRAALRRQHVRSVDLEP